MECSKFKVYDVHGGERDARHCMKHKHLKLDQKKIDFAKRYFGVDAEHAVA
jgi:hypothetical protein